MTVEGIQYVTDQEGRRVAVIIDLERYGDLWEDLYDTILARTRAEEPRESLESVKKYASRAGKAVWVSTGSSLPGQHAKNLKP